MEQKAMTLGDYDATLHALVSKLHIQIVRNQKQAAKETWENLQWALASMKDFIDELK